MPEYCENELTVSGEEVDVAQFLDAVKSDRAILDFERIVPSPAEPGRVPWDEWRMEHWGTKWNTDNPSLEELDPDEGRPGAERAVLLVFGTAWTPPLPVVAAAAAEFFDLDFRLAYWVPYANRHGVLEAENGEVVRHEEAEFFGHRRSRDTDP